MVGLALGGLGGLTLGLADLAEGAGGLELGVFRQPRQPEERQDAQAQPQQQPDSPAGDPNDHDEEALPPANP